MNNETEPVATSVVESLNKLHVPDFEKDFPIIHELAPTFRFPKQALDRIAIFWQKIPEHIKIVGLLEQAINLPGIPQQDKAAAQKYLNDYAHALSPALDAFNRFATTEPKARTWKKNCEPIDNAVIGFNNSRCGNLEPSIISLFAAISETRGQWKDETELHQKIAQHAFEELIDTVGYHKLSQEARWMSRNAPPTESSTPTSTQTMPDWLKQATDAEHPPHELTQEEKHTAEQEAPLDLGDSTIDAPTVEHNEFKSAILSPLWDEEKFKACKKLVDFLIARSEEGLGLEAQLLWEVVNGRSEIPPKKTTVYQKHIEPLIKKITGERIIAIPTLTSTIDIFSKIEIIYQAFMTTSIFDWRSPDDDDD